MNPSLTQTTQKQLENILRQYEQIAELANQQQETGAGASEYQLLTVDGVEGAQAFKMGRNSKAALFDLNEPIFYFKVTDANGNESPLKKFRFYEEEIPKSDGDFVTVRDLNALREDIKKMLEAASVKAAPPPGADGGTIV